MRKRLKLGDDLDRELCFEQTTENYRPVKAIINPKKITFETNSHFTTIGSGTYSLGETIYKSRFTIQKLNRGNKDLVEIEVQNFTKKYRNVKCNLGHVHEGDEYDWNEWQRMILSWDEMEELIEWFQTGRYFDRRSRKIGGR